MATRNCVIVDLDGTLCDCRHREDYAKARQWEEFHSRLMGDQPYEDVKELIDMLTFHDHYIYAVTARSEKWRLLTEQWLNKWKMPISTLIMRPDNNFRSAGDVKLDLLEEHFGDKTTVINSVWLVLENNSKTVELMRNYGLTVWQVREE